MYYLVDFSYITAEIPIFKTDDIENGTAWTSSMLETVCHDPSPKFDHDRAFLESECIFYIAGLKSGSFNTEDKIKQIIAYKLCNYSAL